MEGQRRRGRTVIIYIIYISLCGFEHGTYTNFLNLYLCAKAPTVHCSDVTVVNVLSLRYSHRRLVR